MENKKMAVFVSVPMSGKDEAVIKRSIQLAKRAYCRRKGISARDVDFYDNFNGLKQYAKEFAYDPIEDAKCKEHPNVYLLSFALMGLSHCDEAVFGKGWRDARGCCIEHEVCERYGIPIIDTDKKLKDYLD